MNILTVGMNLRNDAERTVMEPPLKVREVFYNYYVSLTNILGYNVANLLPKLIMQCMLTTNNIVIIEKTVSQ